jgi:hypothetical protein
MEIVFFLLIGALFGVVPMIVGNRKKQKDLGRVGFIFCTLGGLLFPILLPLALAILFTWRIYAIEKMKKSK